jgi:hypothetical protein
MREPKIRNESGHLLMSKAIVMAIVAAAWIVGQKRMMKDLMRAGRLKRKS